MKQQKEDWINKRWRPAMGWMYMAVCIFDFMVFPILFTLVQFWEQEAVNDAFRQWSPLTLQGAGLFHMAMGAVLGITAWSRGQEKIQGVAGGINMPAPPMHGHAEVPYSAPAPVYKESSFEMMAPVRAGYKGKKSPIEPEYPVL